MLVHIGERVLLDGRVVCVVDTDRLSKEAKVGEADSNGIVWDAEWTDTERLCPLEDKKGD